MIIHLNRCINLFWLWHIYFSLNILWVGKITYYLVNFNFELLPFLMNLFLASPYDFLHYSAPLWIKRYFLKTLVIKIFLKLLSFGPKWYSLSSVLLHSDRYYVTLSLSLPKVYEPCLSSARKYLFKLTIVEG